MLLHVAVTFRHSCLPVFAWRRVVLVFSTRNNCCEFLVSDGVIFQCVTKPFFKTSVFGAPLTLFRSPPEEGLDGFWIILKYALFPIIYFFLIFYPIYVHTYKHKHISMDAYVCAVCIFFKLKKDHLLEFSKKFLSQ